MKNLSISVFIFFITIFGFFAVTTPASAMTCNSATLTGNVITGTPPARARFTYATDYNTVLNGGGTPTTVQTFYTDGPIQQLVTGLTESTTYYFRLEVTNNYGTANLNINNFTTPSCQTVQNPTVSITANPTSVSYNGSSVINWTSTNATSCTASGGTNGWSGTQNTSGNFNTGALTSTTTYNIICTNSTGQQATSSATVSVGTQQSQPTVTLTANPSFINYGGTSNLTWYSTNAATCSAYWTSSTATSGSGIVVPTSTTTYNIICTNSTGQQATSSATVSVGTQNNYQTTTVSISADQTNLPYNGSTIIRWYPNNATSCYGSGGSNGWATTQNSYSGSSFNTGPLQYTTTYTISCSNYNNSYGVGAATSSVTVLVGNQGNYQTQSSLTAVTTGATQISNNSAQLNSIISSTGNNNFTNAWFEWGTTINLGNKTTSTPIGSSTSLTHVDTITGLRAGTTYYFRVVAENSSWRSVGSIMSFTTDGNRTVIINPPTSHPTSTVLITSSVNRNQPIVPTIDNTRPHPGDEINYTIYYQNVGNGTITNLALQASLPNEVDYISSNPTNPSISGNFLIFRLGTLRGNDQGSVTIKVRVKDNAAPGTILDFPATLSYTNPSGQPESVNTDISGQVWSETNTSSIGAFVFGAGFLPTNLFGWLLLLILILILILLTKYLYNQPNQILSKKTTTVDHQPFGKKTTTTTVEQ